MTDTARERIEMALMMATGAEIGTDNVLEFIWHLGIPESDLDGLIAGTHRVVPVEPTDRMVEDGGQMLSPTQSLTDNYAYVREAWKVMLAAANPEQPK